MIYLAKIDGKLIATIHYDSSIGKRISEFLMNCLDAGMTLEKMRRAGRRGSTGSAGHQAGQACDGGGKQNGQADTPRTERAATGCASRERTGPETGRQSVSQLEPDRPERSAASLAIPPDGGRDRALPRRAGYPQKRSACASTGTPNSPGCLPTRSVAFP